MTEEKKKKEDYYCMRLLHRVIPLTVHLIFLPLNVGLVQFLELKIDIGHIDGIDFYRNNCQRWQGNRQFVYR